MDKSEIKKFSTEEKRVFLKRLLRDKPRQLKTSHPLSHGQQALWFLHRNAPESPAYNTAAVIRILSPIDVPILIAVFESLIARHPSLRGTFSQQDGQPIQIVHGHQEIRFEEIDASRDTEKELHRRVTETYKRPFDLEQGPLLRVNLFTRAPKDHVLLVAIHHIVTDGWSFWMLLSELLTLYPARMAHQAATLPPLEYQYRDFVKWQADLLAGLEGERLWEYWREQLAGELPILDLPTDRPRPPIQTYNGASVFFTLPETLTQGLKEQARTSRVTLYMILLAAFQVLLHRYTGQEDILVGSPTAGRSRPEFEGICGYFVNPIVLRARLEGDPSFRAFLDQVRRTVLAGLTHQEYPFPLLVERLQPIRDASRSPIFQVDFALQKPQQDSDLSAFLLGGNNEDSRLDKGGLSLAPFTMPQQEGQFDLTLEMIEEKQSLSGVFQYNTDLFDAGTIERMVGHFQCLLEGIVAEPETLVSRLPLLTEMERQRILVEWNDTGAPYPQDKCVHELFEEQVAQTPDAVAVVFPSTGSGQGEDEKVSYFELNARANHLAHRLRGLGVGPEVLVGLFVERSVEMVVGLLAILKAGGAYVPLDPEYPEERLAFMAEDADLKVLLCHGATRERIPECAAHILDVDAESAAIAEECADNPARLAEGNNLAYVIYTSGSTGKPKGVMVEHGMIANHVLDTVSVYGLESRDRVLQFASISFDSSVEQILGPLAVGAALIPRGNTIWTPQECLDNFVRYKVSVAHMTPAYVYQFLGAAARHWEKLGACGFRLLNSGGEALSPATVRLWRETAGGVGKFLNTYGPTEATVTATAFEISADWPGDAVTVPIGKPLSGRTAYILDSHGQPVPIGVPGELYIGGTGVARGYLNRPELTAEKFIPDPFSDDPDVRLYRTGDSCRWPPDDTIAKGNIEFLGRIDTQVKIRGFRIECGEVENALLAHPDVREAVVDARGEGVDKQLVAWVVGTDDTVGATDVGATGRSPVRDGPSPVRDGPSPLRDELRAHLRGMLPDWMVPSVFVSVDTLPLTPSGKIDRKALPDPDTSTLPNLTFVAPATPTEELLANLWAVVLKRETIGRHDNFFDLGGHSLLATQLASRIRDSFDVELPVHMVFEHPELSALAEAIESDSGLSPQLPPIEPQPANALRPLSFAQQRLWFLDRFETGGTAAYNIPTAVRFSGALDVDALQSSLHWMVERHESLRMAFPERGGEAGVAILSAADFQFPARDLRNLGGPTPGSQQLQQRIDEHAAMPFDLARGPLFRAEILQLAKEDGQPKDGQAVHVLLINMHHIISDGWSIGVFVREWQEAYIAFAGGHRPTLVPLPIQYSDYAHWQRQWLQGENLEQQSDYWREALEGIPELLALPTDYPRPAEQSYQGNHYSQTLSADVTIALNTLSRAQGVTLFMTLLAAFDILLSRYSGQDDICVGSPIANRTHTSTENLIGFFVNTLVLRTRLDPDQGFRALLQQVRQTCLGAYAHQDIPFETLVEQLNPTRSLGHSPLFQVMLALQNTAPAKMELPGVAITPLKQAYPIAKFDLTLDIVEQDGQLYCNWEYATSLFTEQTIRRMGEHLEVLLRGIVEAPETPITQLPLLTEAERRRILEWNDTQTPYPQDKCVHELFEEQVAQTPDAVAVVFPSTGSGQGEDEKVSYFELNARANHLAHRLRGLGVGPEVLVGLFVERSVEMVVGLLAILKAGGAYVPLDPEYPEERLAFMAEDAGLEVLLCHGATRERVPECTAYVLDLDAESAAIAGENSANPAQLARQNNLAYVIYTSGSTGKPKGVMVEHKGLTNLAWAQMQAFGVTPEDQVLQFASLNFDASLEQIFSAFLGGAGLVLRGPEIWTVEECLQQVRQRNVTIAEFAPAYLHQFLEFCLKDKDAPSTFPLQRLVTGGEALGIASAILCQRLGLPVFNTYGPTEAAITTTNFHLSGSEKITGTTAPIGRPIANTRVYILDPRLQPVPVGVPGELYIGGVGVARGYLNRQELTAERFIPDPFSDDPDVRLYRTGDSCRWLPDDTIAKGNIEFLGRIDTQVKIRGFRIECGEVENALLAHPDVREAVVDARGEGVDKQLVAWVVGTDDTVGATDVGATGRSPVRDGRSPSVRATGGSPVQGGRSPVRDELRAHLRGMLPDWMVPSVFVSVDALPLTPSGKIDRKALPDPDADAFEIGREYVAPRDPVEDAICAVFAEVLDVARVSVHDNFFALGGHSLSAVKALSSIDERLGVKLPLRALFECPTLVEVAMAVREEKEWQPTILFPLKTDGSRPPLFCVHPVGGGAFCYRELADCLPEDQPVYGIQAVGFEGKEKPLMNVETMAARYVEEMTTLYPGGPYHLYGWSFGGVVAFEMAQQLRIAGREVGLLVLADTAHPSWFQDKDVPEKEQIIAYLLAEAGTGEMVMSNETGEMSPADRIAHLRQQLASGSNLAGFGDIDRFIRIYQANFQALSGYRTSIWEGEMIFLSARERLGTHEKSIDSDWRNLTRKLVHHMIPGNHFTIHRQPNVHRIMEILRNLN